MRVALLRSASEEGTDGALPAVQLRLVYASNSMEDVLLKLHLDAMAAGYYGKFKVLHAVLIVPIPGIKSVASHAAGA